MTTYVALLRGVNLAGNKMVAMEDLRKLASRAGLDEPRTLLQSGNLLFRCDAKGGARGAAGLERLLEAEAVERLGVPIEFHVRSAGEWSAIVARNPFPGEAKRDPGHLLVMTFKAAPAAGSERRLQAAIVGGERVRVVGREAFLVYPDGVGGSKLTTALIDRSLGERGTARNWNTVLKIEAAAGA
jgi:uncharacterized protein (DUF1697 family)